MRRTCRTCSSRRGAGPTTAASRSASTSCATRATSMPAGARSDIAEVALRGLYGPVVEDLARAHGHLAGSGLAVVALGKLGSREMTVSSDLDLVFLYELSPEGTLSDRSEEHTSELQSLMRISYAVFCLKTKKDKNKEHNNSNETIYHRRKQ